MAHMRDGEVVSGDCGMNVKCQCNVLLRSWWRTENQQ